MKKLIIIFILCIVLFSCKTSNDVILDFGVTFNESKTDFITEDIFFILDKNYIIYHGYYMNHNNKMPFKILLSDLTPDYYNIFIKQQYKIIINFKYDLTKNVVLFYPKFVKSRNTTILEVKNMVFKEYETKYILNNPAI